MSDRHSLTIMHDDRSFRDRTERMMQEVRRQMDDDLKRFGFGQSTSWGSPSASSTGSRLWNDWPDLDPVSRLSRDFFKLKPLGDTGTGTPTGSRGRLDGAAGGGGETAVELATRDMFVETPSAAAAVGQAGAVDRRFNMSFDVKDYDAEDISVTVEDDTLVVQAKHRSDKDGAVSVKEFSRKVKIPQEVDPEKLMSTLSSDGILTVEAPTSPVYRVALTDKSATLSHVPGGGTLASSTISPPQSASPPPPSCPESKGQFAVTLPLDTPLFSYNQAVGRRKMDLMLEVGRPYTPEDVIVKLDGKKLVVEATHEEKGQGRTSKSSMQRDFDLPEDIDVASIRALLRSDGRLVITAYGK